MICCSHPKLSLCPPAVVVIPSRFFDVNLFWEMDIDEYTRYCFRNIEMAIEAGRKQNKSGLSTYEFIGIYDMEGLNLRDLMSRKCKSNQFPTILNGTL